MAVQFRETDTVIHEGRSVPQLIRNFIHEVTALLRDEVDLARTEMSEKVSQVGHGMVSVGIGALVLFAGVLVLLDAAVVALAQTLPQDSLWLSPLIIGGIVALIGAIMLGAGRKKFTARNLKPQRTLDELRREKQHLKEKLS